MMIAVAVTILWQRGQAVASISKASTLVSQRSEIMDLLHNPKRISYMITTPGERADEAVSVKLLPGLCLEFEAITNVGGNVIYSPNRRWIA
jgi:hypothetical protein